MDENSYISIKKEFYDFKENLSNNIKDTNFSLENEDCYLIEESWDNELIQYFDKYNNIAINNKKTNKNKYKIDFLNILPEDDPVFINDFSSVFRCLKNHKKMKLVSKKVIESIYEKDDLKENNIIQYYSGNNKIIIEYKENKDEDNKALLVVNPLNIIDMKETAYIISIKDEDKNFLYEEILSGADFDEICQKYQKNILHFDKYLNILNFLINIYYYEKSLLENKETMFKENEDVYLINPKLIDKLKKYYDFNNFVQDFNEIKVENNKEINYNNLYKYLYSIMNYKNNIKFTKKEIFNDIKLIRPDKNNYRGLIEFYTNCYIINSVIMNLIKSMFYYYKIDIKKKNIFIKNNTIYLLYEKNIAIGDINEKLMFIPKYILAYKDTNLLNSAKPNIFSYKIDDYLKSKLKKNSNYMNNSDEYGTFINLSNIENNIALKIYKKVNPSKTFTRNRTIFNNKSFDNKRHFLTRQNSEENESFFGSKEKTLSQPHNNYKKIRSNFFNGINNFNVKNSKGFSVTQNYLQKNIANLNKKVSQYEREYELITKDNKTIRKQLNKANKQVKELEEKINAKNDEIDSLKKSIQKQENEIKLLKINNNELTNEVKNYKSREYNIKNREKEINKKIAFLEDKANYIHKNENKNDKKMLEENIKTLIQENIILIGKNKELEKAIEDLKNPYKLIGLNNIGATYFMNATIQCLSQTKELTNYFLNTKNQDKIINNNIALKNKNYYQLSPVYLELLNKLWDKNGPQSISPKNFMNTIENMNPLFKKGKAGDSKDFIIYILEQLHKELKKSAIKKNNSSKRLKQQLNQFDKDSALNYFFDDFQKESSIISEIFFGFNETTNECTNCKKKYISEGIKNQISYKYGLFNCIIFPLEEIKKIKKNSYRTNNLNQNCIVSLDECFSYNQKNDYYTGNNKNYCKVCKKLCDTLYTSKIFYSPNILILILNRGKGNLYNIKLDFDENIDITQFVLKKDTPRILYNLYGVITQIGQSGPNAHFVASCRSSIDNKWYRFNDAIISPISNIQKDVIEFGTPYILFYQRNK